jgi:TolB-like protein
MTLAAEAPFTIGGVIVQPAICSLTIHGRREQIEPKVMQVLLALHRRKGEVVSRTELHETCWAGRIVSDDSLNRAMTAIRRLSIQSGPDGFTIKTISKVGYCLEDSSSDRPGASEIVLAVLPFESAREVDDSWLSEGMAEGVLETLARGINIRVIGRSSSFQFRGASKAVSVVKAALGITHVLDGSVQREDDVIRVTVQLVEADRETIVWSDRFDEQGGSFFTLRERVAERVAAALDRTIASSTRPARVEARAYELYLRGAELARNIDPESQARAVALLSEAVESAPDLADAWGTLALARAQLAFFDRQSGESRARASLEAQRALEIDPGCASALLVPYVGGPVFDFSEHRMFEVPSPSNHGRAASPDVSFGVQMLEQGRVAEALDFFGRAERYDPLFQILIFYHGLALLCDGKTEEGLSKLEHAAARWPALPFFLAFRIRWAAAAGDWATVDRHTCNEAEFRVALGRRASDVSSWIAFNRSSAPTFEDFLTLRDEAFAAGRSGLEELLLFARARSLEDILGSLHENALPVINQEASRRPDEIGAIALWLPIYDAVRHSPGFTSLTSRILRAAPNSLASSLPRPAGPADSNPH